MPEQRRLDAAVVTVDGTALSADLYGRLMLVQVEESVHLPDSFALHFDDPHFELFDTDRFRIGARVEIAFRAEDEVVVVTYGEVTAISVEPGVTGRHELVLTGLDLTHRLARGPKTRTFAHMSGSDIAARIAGEYGLDADVDATSDTREYVLQAAETDLAFLSRLAAQLGYNVWITEKVFHFKRKPAAHARPYPLRWGDNLHRFSVRFASAEHCDEVLVNAWSPVDKRLITGRSSEGDPGSDAPAAGEMLNATRSAFGRVTRKTGRFPVGSQAEADALAHSLHLRASGGEVVLRGEAAGNPWLQAGAEVSLDRVGRRLSGRYRVTAVQHTYGAQRPYVTSFICGGKEPAEVVDLVRDGSAELGGRALGGLVVGLVTNNDDPDKLGRVKVRFPTLSDADESSWARVATPGGGPHRGVQWLPELGDEVLVGFEFDDKTRPMVLGGLWNRKDPPPQADVASGGQTNGRILASRRNHRLSLVDDPTGAVELTLGDAKTALHLEKADSSLTGEQKLRVKAATVEITADQKLTISAPQIEITANGELKLTGKPIRLN